MTNMRVLKVSSVKHCTNQNVEKSPHIFVPVLNGKCILQDELNSFPLKYDNINVCQ